MRDGRRKGFAPASTDPHRLCRQPQNRQERPAAPVVSPGSGVFALGYIPESSGYNETHEEKRATLTAGETVTIRFELEKAP